MSITLKVQCDVEDCGTWVEHRRDEGYCPPGWLVVNDSGLRYHYCTWNCLLLAASTVAPPEEFDA